MCSIFKKGDKRLCENQQGITLMSHPCKIFTRMLTKRAYKYCETINILPESQCAFRSNRSTVDMMFTAKLLQQSCREKEIALYLAFLDITKAYDSVDRETMWKILEIIGFPTKILSIFKLLYGEASCKIRWNGKFFTYFHINAGTETSMPCGLPIFQHIFFSHIFCHRPEAHRQGSSALIQISWKHIWYFKIKISNKNSAENNSWIAICWWFSCMFNIWSRIANYYFCFLWNLQRIWASTCN